MELKANPKNWRKHPQAQATGLNAVLQEIGWVQSVILNQNTGNLIDGHLRIELAIKNGETEVPVVVVDLSPEEEDAILASFDPISSMAKVNHEMLSSLISGITTTNPALKELIDRIRKQSCIPMKLEGGDENIEPKESAIKVGDLFRLGEHVLMCGSSANPDHVKQLFAAVGLQPVLMVTDPPYGVDYGSVEEMRHDCTDNCATREGISGDKTVEEAKVLWDYSFGNIYPYFKDGASFYCFSPQGPNFYALAKSLEEAGFIIHQHIVWNKNRFIFSRSDYKYKHEMIIYGWKKGTHTFYAGGNEISVWDCDAPQKSELHPTQKPVALYEKAIINNSQIGEVVVDPFGGSGTLIIACENKQRKAVVMELDPGYCESSIERWEQLTGKKREKI